MSIGQEIVAGKFSPTGNVLPQGSPPAIAAPQQQDGDEYFEIPKGYKWAGIIGSGAFGTVVKIIKESDGGGEFALKRVREYSTMTGPACLSYAKKICREVAALQALQGLPNIVPLTMTYLSTNKKHVYILMPFSEFELEYAIQQKTRSKNPFQEEEIKWIAYQVFVAAAACHSKKIMHRDITLRNILLDKELNVCLADFGLARASQNCHHSITLDVVTLEYRAPELLLQYDKYGYKVDMWSIGCIIAELYLQHRLFEPDPRDIRNALLVQVQNLGKPDLEWIRENAPEPAVNFLENVLFSILDSKVDQGEDPYCRPIPERLAKAGASPAAIDLIMKLLQFDFPKRLSAAEALKCDWFAKDEEYAECDGVLGTLSFLNENAENKEATEEIEKESYRDGTADEDDNPELNKIQRAETIEQLRALMEERVTPNVEVYTVKVQQ